MRHSLAPVGLANASEIKIFSPVASHVYCDHWAQMAHLHQPETNLVILKRAPLRCPDAFAEILQHSRSFAQVAIDRGMDLQIIPALLDEDLDRRAEDSLDLYLDIQRQAGHFFELTGARRIGVRVERVESDNCRLFHVDQVEARLVSTYFGKGTEWLQNEGVVRSGLGLNDNDSVMKPNAEIQALATGWIAVMKGERNNAGKGLVHRSPPIEEAGSSRILLRMDVLP